MSGTADSAPRVKVEARGTVRAPAERVYNLIASFLARVYREELALIGRVATS